MAEKLQDQYRSITRDHFPPRMEIRFSGPSGETVFLYEKAGWTIDGESRGLRYGENPEQQAALYRLLNGSLALLASDVELLQSGKHPGKINITDVDSALGILRYFSRRPCAVIIKHNNPCGVALGDDIAHAFRPFRRAFLADRLAAFGGAVALNREVNRETALALTENYAEVVAAPEYGPGAMEILEKKKNLRVMRIRNMADLGSWEGRVFLDFKSLLDGGLILQTSYAPRTLAKEDFLPAETVHQGATLRVLREPTDREYRDMLFGWLVETGVTSNSVLYVKDEATLGIGAGEQDRVGVAEIARDKAYRKLEDRLAWERRGKPFSALPPGEGEAIREEVRALKGGLPGAVMVSDGFFPFRDGIDVGLREGVSAVVQPGGSLRDFESIQACNEAGAAMKFTGQRSFRH